MKEEEHPVRPAEKPPQTTELLVLRDGRVLVHNLTPAFAELLLELNPADEQIRSRASRVPPRDP